MVGKTSVEAEKAARKKASQKQEWLERASFDAPEINLTRSLGGLDTEGSLAHDTGQFYFLGNPSFDTLNDPLAFMSPARGAQTFESRTGSNLSKPDADESDDSLGDISPIQLPSSSSADKIDLSATDHQWHCDRFHTLELASGLVSNPFYVIRSMRKVFESCKYVLNATRDDEALVCPVNISYPGHIQQLKQHVGPSSSDWTLATRRVETAIIAFGGSAPLGGRSTIFRTKHDPAHKHDYERRLPFRYHLTGSMVSWDLEEDPPIRIEAATDHGFEVLSAGGVALSVREKNATDSSPRESPRSHQSSNHPPSVDVFDETTKLRYRCKLCGQPKQNHHCPYSKCLHRSIGVMVYPSVNAFTAAEPGYIAPPLTQMNNFVSYDTQHATTGSPKSDLLHSCSLSASVCNATLLPVQVSPESRLTATSFFNSPQSSLSNQSEEAMTGVDTPTTGLKRTYSGTELARAVGPTRPSVFVNAVNLKPEHYRAISSTETETWSYQYQAIPLTFVERKRLSDTLFHLSSEIPQFASDVAGLLHVARHNHEWDQAVAELLTQVVVAMYCSEGDVTLDGLRQYLLGLGIAC